MEQQVWIFIGIVSVILAFGMVAKIVYVNQEQTRFQKLESALNQLELQCNLVCQSSVGTLLSTKAELPSGISISVNEQDRSKICGVFEEKTKCVKCLCSVESDGALELNTTQAKKMFYTHIYFCSFERIQNGTKMVCEG